MELLARRARRQAREPRAKGAPQLPAGHSSGWALIAQDGPPLLVT